MWQALLGDLCDVCVFQLGADKSSPCYEINRCTGKTGLQSAAIVKDHDKAISIYFNQFHLNWLLGLSKASKMWDSWHFAATWCLQDWCSWQGLGTQGWQPRALIPTPYTYHDDDADADADDDDDDGCTLVGWSGPCGPNVRRFWSLYRFMKSSESVFWWVKCWRWGKLADHMKDRMKGTSFALGQFSRCGCLDVCQEAAPDVLKIKGCLAAPSPTSSP